MCGIAGFLDKTQNDRIQVGKIISDMLEALGRRGPDSAGVAIYSHSLDGDLVMRVKLADDSQSNAVRQDLDERGSRIAEFVRGLGPVGETSRTAEYLRLVMDFAGDLRSLEGQIESLHPDIEVVSMGRSLEIVKQVGSPQNLQSTHKIASMLGSHGIGHTRMSTESRIDLSHSQPFWAHGYPDLSIVHNGHITNYHRLRRQYEQRGVRFYTENDSEIIGIYLAEQLERGLSIEEALHQSLADLDGSFSYFFAMPDTLGFVRDPYALKPLLFTETDQFVAIANEEIAIRAAFPGSYDVREAKASEVRVWQR